MYPSRSPINSLAFWAFCYWWSYHLWRYDDKSTMKATAHAFHHGQGFKLLPVRRKPIWLAKSTSGLFDGSAVDTQAETKAWSKPTGTTIVLPYQAALQGDIFIKRSGHLSLHPDRTLISIAFNTMMFAVSIRTSSPACSNLTIAAKVAVWEYRDAFVFFLYPATTEVLVAVTQFRCPVCLNGRHFLWVAVSHESLLMRRFLFFYRIDRFVISLPGLHDRSLTWTGLLPPHKAVARGMAIFMNPAKHHRSDVALPR